VQAFLGLRERSVQVARASAAAGSLPNATLHKTLAPATYGDIDHSSAEVYRGYDAQPRGGVITECRRVSAELADRMWVLPDEDLLDPARHRG